MTMSDRYGPALVLGVVMGVVVTALSSLVFGLIWWGALVMGLAAGILTTLVCIEGG